MERKEAIEVVKKNYPHVNESGSQFETALRTLIPELKESEDEKIRKWIIENIQETLDVDGFFEEHKTMAKNAIAWLEKQGEQKPAENKGMNLAEEDMTPFQKKVFCIIDTTIEKEQGLKQVCDELLRLAHDESMQNTAWSEEDKEITRSLLDIIYECHSYGKCALKLNEYSKLYNWLKSLKERYTWKPSEEQIEALLKLEEMHVLEHEKNQENAHLYMVVKSIREQLLKLREE